jgi:hypothetical protein
MNKISIVITYCSLDKRFIETNIEQCLKISDDVVVSSYDHLFNGEHEDEEIDYFWDLRYKYPTVKFVLCQWEDVIDNPRYWHNMGRLRGYEKTNKNYDWIIFLDGDEILKADTFNLFLQDPNLNNKDWYILTVNWFFREPIYKSTELEHTIPLYKKSILSFDPFEPFVERGQPCMKNPNGIDYLTYNGEILVNHYSWVRTKEQMLKKVSGWGHKTDKDWVALVEEEFSRPFNGTDFVHNYKFETVEDVYGFGVVNPNPITYTIPKINIVEGDVHLFVDGVQTGQTKAVQPPFLKIIKDFDTIIEIGTFTGAFTKWLSVFKNDNCELLTFDITTEHFKFYDSLNSNFQLIVKDCFSDEGQSIIIDKIRNGGRVLLLCDGGSKNREFNLFSNYLKNNDVILLHDYQETPERYSQIANRLNWRFGAESSYEEIKKSVIDLGFTKHSLYEEFENVFWGSFIKK